MDGLGKEVERGLLSARETSSSNRALEVQEYVPAEVNLEVMGYFRAGYKHIYPSKPKEVRSVTVGNRTIQFVPSSFGYPNTHDQDFYRGFLKLCNEQVECVETVGEAGRTRLICKLPQPIEFSTRSLILESGRQERAEERRAVRDFIKRNNTTGIHGKLIVRKPDGSLEEREAGTEPLFRRFLCVGDPVPGGGKASKNAVWLAGWFCENYANRYLKSVNLTLHQSLETPTAKALAPILDNGWFATRGDPWKKRYDDIAELLGIPRKGYISKIMEQLDPSHAELKRTGFLAAWSYEKASDSTGYVLSWTPGPKWFEDQRAYDERRRTAHQIARRQHPPRRIDNVGTQQFTDREQHLIDDVVTGLDDERSRRFWEKVVRAGDVSESMLRGFVGEANYRAKMHTIDSTKAAFAVDLLKRYRAGRTRPTEALNKYLLSEPVPSSSQSVEQPIPVLIKDLPKDEQRQQELPPAI